MNNIEEKRNKLNTELRAILEIISMIDGYDFTYENYKKNELMEEEYLDKQILLAADAKFRLIDIFKK